MTTGDQFLLRLSATLSDFFGHKVFVTDYELNQDIPDYKGIAVGLAPCSGTMTLTARVYPEAERKSRDVGPPALGQGPELLPAPPERDR